MRLSSFQANIQNSDANISHTIEAAAAAWAIARDRTTRAWATRKWAKIVDSGWQCCSKCHVRCPTSASAIWRRPSARPTATSSDANPEYVRQCQYVYAIAVTINIQRHVCITISKFAATKYLKLFADGRIESPIAHRCRFAAASSKGECFRTAYFPLGRLWLINSSHFFLFHCQHRSKQCLKIQHVITSSRSKRIKCVNIWANHSTSPPNGVNTINRYNSINITSNNRIHKTPIINANNKNPATINPCPRTIVKWIQAKTVRRADM